MKSSIIVLSLVIAVPITCFLVFRVWKKNERPFASKLIIQRPIPIELPWPTEGFGSKIVRRGWVTQSKNGSTIYWPGAPEGTQPWSRSDIETEVQELPEIKNKADTLKHFQTFVLKSVPDSLERGVVEQDFPIGKLITIDTGKLLYAPGNTYHYLLPVTPGSNAIYIGPTYFLEFDWTLAQ